MAYLRQLDTWSKDIQFTVLFMNLYFKVRYVIQFVWNFCYKVPRTVGFICSLVKVFFCQTCASALPSPDTMEPCPAAHFLPCFLPTLPFLSNQLLYSTTSLLCLFTLSHSLLLLILLHRPSHLWFANHHFSGSSLPSPFIQFYLISSSPPTLLLPSFLFHLDFTAH